MTKSVFEEVGDALVARLIDANFETTVTVERSYADVNDDLPALKDPRIDVVLWKPDADLDAVGQLDYAHTWDIWIRRRFKETDLNTGTGRVELAEIDKMVKLVQDVWECLVPCQPTQDGILTTETGLQAKWDPGATRLLDLYIRNHLKKLTQFTGWIRVGYKVQKAVG